MTITCKKSISITLHFGKQKTKNIYYKNFNKIYKTNVDYGILMIINCYR